LNVLEEIGNQNEHAYTRKHSHAQIANELTIENFHVLFGQIKIRLNKQRKKKKAISINKRGEKRRNKLLSPAHLHTVSIGLAMSNISFSSKETAIQKGFRTVAGE
jgi:hypothetical protein